MARQLSYTVQSDTRALDCRATSTEKRSNLNLRKENGSTDLARPPFNMRISRNREFFD